MITFVNCTTHEINVYNGQTLVATFPPSGMVTRVSTFPSEVTTLYGGIQLFVNAYGPIVDLPAQKENTMYIVSAMVRSASSRTDLVSPGESIRNEQGQPIGCLGFVINP